MDEEEKEEEEAAARGPPGATVLERHEGLWECGTGPVLPRPRTRRVLEPR